MRADRRLWLAQDRCTLVEDGGTDAAFLLAAGEGAHVPDAEAQRLGLVSEDGRIVQRPTATLPPAASQDTTERLAAIEARCTQIEAQLVSLGGCLDDLSYALARLEQPQDTPDSMDGVAGVSGETATATRKSRRGA